MSPCALVSACCQASGALRFTFTNSIGAPFTVLGSSDIALPIEDWTILGQAIDVKLVD